MDYANKRLADALAAQYAAGALRGRARRRFEALLPGHPALQEAVREWQARLMPLTGVIAPVPPPPNVWRRVQRQLWPEAAPLPWWRKLGVWRGAAALASVAAVSLAVVLTQPRPELAPVVIVLQGTGGEVQGVNTFVASVSGDGRALVVRPLVPVSIDAQRALELWSVPPQGAPRSLGLISAAHATRIARERLPATLLTGGTSALAVSIEPPGGSPTGTPTGPVVHAGKLQI
jgi:anti-sigma-K factor RskA